jgi:hypothetical protein
MRTLSLEPATNPPDVSQAREGSVWRDLDGGICGRSYLQGNLRVLDWHDAGLFAFSPTSAIVRVWPARGVSFESAAQEFDHMLRPIVLQALGWQALHAGAALTPAGALLFCGRSGAGKSTLAYALGHSGHRQLADDQVVWQLDNGAPVVSPLPFQPRLRPRSRQYFATSPARTRKQPAADGPVPILAIYLLEQCKTGAATADVVRLSPARAFSALLPHAHCFDVTDVEATRRVASDYLTLAERTPVFTLSYAPDLDRLPELAGTILSTADAAAILVC